MIETAEQGSLGGGTGDTPMISAPTADGYQQAHQALVKRAQAFLDTEDGDSLPMIRHARRLSEELRAENYQPREKLTRTEVHRNALKRTIEAIDEFGELEHHHGQLVSSWKVWEEFQRAIKSGARSDSYGPGDTTWAPEDDTNPLRTTPVPEPDPAAEPINGIRQGEWVQSRWDDHPRRVLTVVDHDLMGRSVRLSDARDGTFFGGYFISPDMLGSDYVKTDPPSASEEDRAPTSDDARAESPGATGGIQ
jgi:hypothetical protein